jgi:hypothetical protein
VHAHSIGYPSGFALLSKTNMDSLAADRSPFCLLKNQYQCHLMSNQTGRQNRTLFMTPIGHRPNIINQGHEVGPHQAHKRCHLLSASFEFTFAETY